MLLTMMKSKIHRATVTEADLNYVGSVTIDINLMKAANILPYEQVFIVNNNNGARFVTYAIIGEADSGVICLNGAAARMVQPNDVIIIMSFAQMTEEEAKTFAPQVLIMNHDNTIKEILNHETAGEIL